MNNNKIAQLVRQFLENRYSKETEEKVQQWILDEKDFEEKEKASFEYWTSLREQPDGSTRRALKKVNRKIGIKRIIPLYHTLQRIAVVLIPMFIVSGLYFYYHNSQKAEEIRLAAAFGETKQIILPDSSKVWLNSGSSIRYSLPFKKNRQIYLEGEAYFMVEKDPSRPFIVQTPHLSVRVLGTEFNVKAFPEDAQTIATLTKGKVEVKTNAEKSYVLRPNEQLIHNNLTKETNITQIKAEDAAAWRTGQLFFIDSSLEEILNTLERRFDVSFIMEGKNIPKENYTIKFLRNDSLDQILEILKEVARTFTYEKESDTIIIKSNK